MFSDKVNWIELDSYHFVSWSCQYCEYYSKECLLDVCHKKAVVLFGKVWLGSDLFWAITKPLAHVSGILHPSLYPYH